MKAFKPTEMIVASGVKFDAKPSDAHRVCSEALKRGIRSVCIPSVYVGEVAFSAGNAGLRLSTMISFPNGLMPVELKIMEMRLASEQGVEEAYFYPNLGNYLDSRLVEFEWELSRIAEESQLIGLDEVKPVIEVDLVSEKQLREIAGILRISGFNSLVASSGFGAKAMRPEGLAFLKSMGEAMMIEVHCRIGSLSDLRKLFENRVCKVCTVDYEVVSGDDSSGFIA